MNFSDIFKKSFLESVSTGDLSWKKIALVFAISCVFAAYIFLVYRIITRKTFYNKNFNISLAANTVIVSSVILTIQSSIVVSLGMVGALSIVRYRTAIKNPMDLTFLFWSISIGIICGAGLPGIALISSFLLTIGIIILNAIPVAKSPMLLIINAKDKNARIKILEAVKENTAAYTVKTQTMENECLDMIIEVRTKTPDELIDKINTIEKVSRCSLISHDGETTF